MHASKHMLKTAAALAACALSVAALAAGLEGPVVIRAERADASPALRDLARQFVGPKGLMLPKPKMMPEESLPKATENLGRSAFRSQADPVVQTFPGIGAMPAPLSGWEGVQNLDNAFPVLPPDTNGDVGPNHYVQWVNLSLAIWDKQGNLLVGPVDGNALWSGFGGPADSCNDGDPVVLYDSLADRWFISQFALCLNNYNGPFYQYVAVSQTPDPTGPWYRYVFQWPGGKLNDYPKFGVWPDGYYMTANQFTAAGSWAGAGVAVMDRAKLLAGDPSASMQYLDLAQVSLNYGGILPSHLEGPVPPPAGSPNVFMEMDDDAWGWPSDQLTLWEFHVDWANPANSTFGAAGQPTAVIPVAPFDSDLCGYDYCVAQPGTLSRLDAISDRLMYRLQYRNFGAYQTLVVNHTVDADGADHPGVRWYELRKDASDWTVAQQGTYAPDADGRWMASAALDHEGNLAVGYSVASGATYPSIRYAGRLATDPPNELTQGEASMAAGTGSQFNPNGRWGDYSSLSVDPADDCTFWYTQEYYTAGSLYYWQTRVGSFRFPTCAPLTPIQVEPNADVTSGDLPLTVNFDASASGGAGPYAYTWAFGDGGHATGTNVSHTFTRAGTYAVWVTATDGQHPAGSESVGVTVVVEPPVISSVSKAGNPFRLKILGSNFHSACTVKVNGVPAPQTSFKNEGKVVAKKGGTLKAMVPKGVSVLVTVTNEDDGGVSAAYPFVW